ncbi:MAG: SDR family NAD(P)-dependent oxidoreductase [Proteobacteria bacterium]|nr:SDR family NAD(P)-dependent oxidoreductase [Pseudomonadota bacterium]MDA1299300.1 SDR family NAD(P)-dependent oxidoreductase [Pseudomonadota bacterium]
MEDFSGKIAVVTGGGTGMGRELVRQLVAQGCHVATCDIIAPNLDRTIELCREQAPQGVRVTGHICDVAAEDQVERLQQEVATEHETEHINLLFNNAGIGGGGSFVDATREEWERTFNICWNGVYYFCRTFLPMLLASTEGHIVNTSSVNGFRASLGGNIPHTAYSAAKFAVKGFTEALINDFRFNAPHLKASVVMPGGVGTDIAINSSRILGHGAPKDWTNEEIEAMRARWIRMGAHRDSLRIDERMLEMTNDEIRQAMTEREENYRNIGITPAQAATIILDGVKQGHWRILVGKDAEALDRAVRKDPLHAYDLDFDRHVRAQWDGKPHGSDL